MFEFLGTLSIGDAAVVSHYAIQVIRQWAAAVSISVSLEDMLVTGGLELTPFQVETIKAIIGDVEHHARRTVRELSQEERAEYVEQIATRLLEISKLQPGNDAMKGRTLLRSLRSTINI